MSVVSVGGGRKLSPSSIGGRICPLASASAPALAAGHSLLGVELRRRVAHLPGAKRVLAPATAIEESNMLDEQEAPVAEDDAVDVADVGGDDAVDLAEMGAEVETADEPAVSAEELLDIPDAPEIPGKDDHIEQTLGEAEDSNPPEPVDSTAADLGAQAAAEDAQAAAAGEGPAATA